jgi:hypothetical protein
MLTIHDNIIDLATHKKVYDWGQSVSWYTKPLLTEQGKYEKEFHNESKNSYTHEREFDFPIQEYNPSLMGNHVAGAEDLRKNTKEIVSIFRHPIGWSDQSVKERNPIVWDLWSRINDVVFGGKGKLDGMKESHLGIIGPKSNFIDQIGFHEKYNVPNTRGGVKWTCFLNARHARSARPVSSGIGGRMGEIHKDSDNRISDKHFTVLYVSNLEWRPLWGGHLEFYNNDFTGDKHWKHNYNIGWPDAAVGNVPNRVIVYSHDQIHRTWAPLPRAPEMTQKIAFRVVVE